MDRDFPGVASLRPQSCASRDVNPIALEINILRSKPLAFAGTHSCERKRGERRQADGRAVGKNLMNLLKHRAANRVRLGPAKLPGAQRIASDQVALGAPDQECL